MNRRELLQGSAALSLATFATLAQAAEKKKTEPMNHDHHEHHHGAPSYAALAHAATHCVMLGEACIGHCLQLLGEGKKEMAACAQSVEQTIAACDALRQLATWNSPYVPRLAKVVMDMCKDCEKECRKHEEHKSCRDCAEACVECYKECEKVAA